MRKEKPYILIRPVGSLEKIGLSALNIGNTSAQFAVDITVFGGDYLLTTGLAALT